MLPILHVQKQRNVINTYFCRIASESIQSYQWAIFSGVESSITVHIQMLYTKKKTKPGLTQDDSVDIPNEISSIDAMKDHRKGHDTVQEPLVSETVDCNEAPPRAGEEAVHKVGTNTDSAHYARPLEADVVDDHDVDKADSDKASTVYEEVSVR